MFRQTFWNGINMLLLISIVLLCLTQVQCDQQGESTAEPGNSKEKTYKDVSKENNDNYGSKSGENGKHDGEYYNKDDKKSDKKYGKSKGDNYGTGDDYNKDKDKDKKKNYKSSDKKYGQDMVGDKYRSYDRYSGSRERNYHNKGIDPDTYGQDIADRKDIYEDKELMVASVYVWIKNAHKWNQPDKHPYRPDRNNKNRYGKDSKKKYSKDKNYKGKDSDSYDDYKDKDNYNKGKDKYEKVTFPVRVYKSYKKFPHKNFPTLLNALPWTPIFYDKLTYQTFIYCPTGHFLVLPPLINFFGQRFAVAQLIKWGYASLVSTGLPPGPGLNAFPLVQPAGAPGAPAAPALPYNPKNGQYNGGVTTNYGSFKPKSY